MKESSLMEGHVKVLKSSQTLKIFEPDINHNSTWNPCDTKQKTMLKSSEITTNQCSTPKSRKPFFSSSFNWSSSSPNQEKDTSVFYSTLFCEEMQTTVGLIRDYVVCTLKHCGLASKVFVTSYPPSKDELLRHRIILAGRAFEHLHPNLFKHISRKLGYIFDSESTVRRIYYRLATHIVGVDSRNFTWGRVLALFCLAGAVAMDCVSQGHHELVEEVIKISSDFIKQNILEWVVGRGGWITMAEHFTKSHVSNRSFWILPNFKDPTLSKTTFGLIAFSLVSFIGFHLFV